MSIDLSPDNQRFLDDAVGRGIYRDATHALDEAVELLRRRDELRAEVQIGIDQANRGELLDGEEVMAQFVERARRITESARRHG